MQRSRLALSLLLVTQLLVSPVLATCGGGGGGGLGGITPPPGRGGSPGDQVYRVPWEVMAPGKVHTAGDMALYWFPISEEAAVGSELMTSRQLTLWSSQCVGMGLVALDNLGARQQLGAGSGEVAILLTKEGGEIGRLSAGSEGLALDAVESLIFDEMKVRRRLVEDTLDSAKALRKNKDEEGAVALYQQVFGQRCLFPGPAKKAAKALKKLGQPVTEASWSFGDDGPELAEPDFGRRTGERVAKSIDRGLEAESALSIEEAERYYLTARNSDRGDPVPLRYLGELHRHHTGDWDLAREYFEQILAMPADPISKAVALHGLGKMTLHAADFGRGLALIEESIDTYPLPLAYRNLAVYWNSEGETDRAWSYTEAALELAPEDTYNQLFAATYFVGQGRQDEALRLVQLHGGLLEASYNLAAIHAQLGDKQKALSLLARHFEEYEQTDAIRAREMKEAREDIVFVEYHNDSDFRRVTRLASGG